MKNKILILIGTRPEAIKMCPLILELRKSEFFELLVCASGQHTEMIKQVTDVFSVKVDFELNSLLKNQSLSELSTKIMFKFSELLEKLRPSLVMVHGDTATTAIGALAAYYNKIKIGHVEAGLRTGDIYFPWPEEGNRKMVTAISRYHFAPTTRAKEKLLSENVRSDTISVTGNTVIDALLYVNAQIDNDLKLKTNFANKFSFLDKHKKIILVTCHRRENHGQGIINLCDAIEVLLSKNNDIQFVLPVHPNPEVSRVIYKKLSKLLNINLIQPLSYVAFIWLMKQANLVISDSGGIQEEAPALGKPVLLLRNETERPEAVEAGTVKLIGCSKENIIFNVELLLNNTNEYQKMADASNPYGDGTASKKIRTFLENNL